MSGLREELFVEISTEEIPARLLDGAAEALEAGLIKLLGAIPHGAARRYATPRRIAVAVAEVAMTRPSTVKLITGPPAPQVFVSGDPAKGLTPAGEAFCRARGVSPESLELMDGPKGKVAACRKVEGGEPTHAVIAAGLEALILGIPFKRSMRWSAGSARFARPIHGVCARHGQRKIEARVAGMETTDRSRGHFLLAPEMFSFRDSLDWLTELRSRHVLADPHERRGQILHQLRTRLEELGADAGDGTIDAELLAEVVNLVEAPRVIVGAFAPELLELPPRLLVESMKKHQRYFPVYRDGVLTNQFLVVTNNPFGDAAIIAEGNARVLAARFHDARFFYAEDRQLRLEAHGAKLGGMMWIRGLGTMAARQEALSLAAAELAADTGADPAEAARAGALCKADLCTQMVGEFPELQGHVGRLLAALDGEPEAVSRAIEEHWLPRFAGDTLPQTPAGRALALAERLTLLSQAWSIGIRPSATTDPQGLRRAAAGALQILLDMGRRGDIRTLLDRACPNNRAHHAEVAEFIQGRLKAMLTADPLPADLVEAVIATSGMDLVHDALRARALGALVRDGTFGPIKITFRRAAGLVKDHALAAYDPARFQHDAEQDLHRALALVPDARGDADAMIAALAALKPHVDRLFDAVLVMCEDPDLRNNRLGLLKSVTQRFAGLADFTRLSVE